MHPITRLAWWLIVFGTVAAAMSPKPSQIEAGIVLLLFLLWVCVEMGSGGGKRGL